MLICPLIPFHLGFIFIAPFSPLPLVRFVRKVYPTTFVQQQQQHLLEKRDVDSWEGSDDFAFVCCRMNANVPLSIEQSRRERERESEKGLLLLWPQMNMYRSKKKRKRRLPMTSQPTNSLSFSLSLSFYLDVISPTIL